VAQTSYSLTVPVGFEGAMGDYNHGTVIETFTNARENVSQVTTGTVVANNGDAVGVYIDGVLVSDTSTASASATATLLKDAVNANAFVKDKVVATTDGADLILTFTDYESHTVTAYTPATADVTPIANDTEAQKEENMPFGRVVVRDTAGDYLCRLPASGAVNVVGILIHSLATEPGLLPASDTSAGWPSHKPANILRRGRVWMVTEQNVTPASTVYFRHTAPGASPEALGRVREDNDGGDATALPTGKFMTTATAGNLVLVEVNLP
jgi:hypothetical protein